MDTLVTTAWLADQLGAADLVVLDCTIFLKMGKGGYESESGRASFEHEHIPGAAFADLNVDLVDATSPHRYAMPSPEHFGAAMERLGVSDVSRVVLYDNGQAMWATRVWWMLRWIGFDNAAVLDGGLKAWKADGRSLEAGEDGPAPAVAGSLSLAPRPELIADKQEVLGAISDGATCLIDSLPPAVYAGEVAPYGRAGHIPTAVNVPSGSMIDPDTGRFLASDVIEAMLPERRDDRTVVY